jgi:hypothetical protein
MTKKTAIRNAVSKMDPGSRFTAPCGDCICIYSQYSEDDPVEDFCRVGRKPRK